MTPVPVAPDEWRGARIPDAATPDADRSARLMTGLIAVSRVSGFGRLLVAVAVLGTASPLSNVYSSANTIPTLVFEMLAAGALSATLLPEFRRRLTGRDPLAASQLASSVLLWGGIILGALIIGVIAAREPIARGLLSGIVDPASRDDAVALMGVLIIWFAPQLLAYLANTVAVAYLQAQHRFGASVLCPLVNNVVLIGAYTLFWLQRDGADPSLDLTNAQIVTLGAGTLLGVVAMCAVPAFDAWRAGVRWVRPLAVTDPQLRRVARDGIWAAVFLAGGQAILAATLPITNAYDGHGIVWLVAWQVFMLPHALLAVPAMTARFPTMAAAHDCGDGDQLERVLQAGIRSVLGTGLLAGALMWGLAEPLGQLLAVGASRDAGELFASAVRALGPGVAAFGMLHLLARRCYASGDTRTPAIVAMGVAVAAIMSMVAIVGRVDVAQRLGVIGWAVSLSNLAGAMVLAWRLGVRPDAMVARRVAAAVGAGAVGWWCVQLLGPADGVVAQIASCAVGAVAGTAVYLGFDRLGGGPTTRAFIATLGAAERS